MSHLSRKSISKPYVNNLKCILMNVLYYDFYRPLFSLQSPSSARDKKHQTAGDLLTTSTWGQGQGRRLVLQFSFSGSALILRPFALADVFEKNEKKNKTTFVYRLSSFLTRFQRSSNGLWYLKGLFCMAGTRELLQPANTADSSKGRERKKKLYISRDPLLAARARRASSTRVREG